MNNRLLALAAAVLSLVGASRTSAHTASTAWLNLTISNRVVTGTWDVAIRDLDDALDLDADDDGRITWGELRSRQPEIDKFLFSRLTLQGNGQALTPLVIRHAICERGGNACEEFTFSAPSPATLAEVSVEYRLFFERDPLHRGLVGAVFDGRRAATTAILSPDHTMAVFHPGEPPAAAPLLRFAAEGVHHIWTGYDHLLFLLALLLPSVVRRGPAGWRPEESFPAALRHVLQVVTAFTVAHSITLALAATGAVRLPPRWVESSIAVSIAVAALANLRTAGRLRPAKAGAPDRRALPLIARPWVMPFAFGLIHGFGFAAALADLGLRRGSLAVPLVGFNAGVEAGQLACVGLFLPLAFAARSTRAYRSGALPLGSAAILFIAGGWFLERAFDYRILPF